MPKNRREIYGTVGRCDHSNSDRESLVIPLASPLQHALFRSRARKKFSEGVGVVKDGVIHSTRRKVFPSRNLITSKLGNKTRQYLSFVGNIFFVIELDVAWVACE